MNKGERVNLGKYQAPVHIAKKTLGLYSFKSYFFNAAALRIGLKGADRRHQPAPPKPADPELEAKPTVKQAGKEPWTAETTNQLDRAAYVFGDIENYF
eukprot:2571707-Pyramimonas_sp.AAC.1